MSASGQVERSHRTHPSTPIPPKLRGSDSVSAVFSVTMIGCSAPYRESVGARLIANGLMADETTPPDATQGHVLIIQCNDEAAWQDLEARANDPDQIVVAVIPALEMEGYIRALGSGAAGVVYVDTPSSITAEMIVAATEGEVVLPRQAAQSLAMLARRDKPRTELDSVETALLRAVASGQTIVDLAKELHYSERTVRRHLQSLYLKLGVRNRAEAIAAATRLGITD